MTDHGRAVLSELASETGTQVIVISHHRSVQTRAARTFEVESGTAGGSGESRLARIIDRTRQAI